MADSVDPEERIILELSDEERRLLRSGMAVWGGPDACTEEMAIAIGFASVDDLYRESSVLVGELDAGAGIRRLDWLRIILSTAVAFACEPVGAGLDWSSVVGVRDDEAIVVLRRLQRRFLREGVYRGLRVGTRRKRRHA